MAFVGAEVDYEPRRSNVGSAIFLLYLVSIEVRVFFHNPSVGRGVDKIILNSGYPDFSIINRVTNIFTYNGFLSNHIVKDVEKAVLRVLDDSKLELTPNNIARNAGYSSGYVRKECNRMASLGLLKKDDDGSDPFYSITDNGQAYLAGELDIEDLEIEDD